MDSSNVSISDAFKSCLEHLERLVVRLEFEDDKSTTSQLWNDELGRLRLWGGNLAAHQTGQASLEYRLKGASHIRQNVVDLLSALRQSLEDTEEVLEDADTSEDESAPVPVASGQAAESELQQLHREVVSIIKDLFQMALLIRKPAQHSRLTEAQPHEVSVFNHYDQQHVRDKFPKADERLVHRLGLALTRRRKYLKYQERHHAKLSKGLVQPVRSDRSTRDDVSQLSETIVSNLMIEEPTGREEDSRSDTSEVSFASTFVQSESVRLPKPPEDALDGLPVECPYCRYIIVVHSSHAWVKHLYTDLQPYSCLALNCTTPHKLYSTQREWSRHLNANHVNLGLDVEGIGQETCISCPLCMLPIAMGTDLERHLARHLQELALFVIPSADDESDDESEKGNRLSVSSYSSDPHNTPVNNTLHLATDDGLWTEVTEDLVSEEAIIEKKTVGLAGEDGLWTEVTEDLISEEAIKEKGYEYSKSGGCYYIHKYLKYDDVLSLTTLSKDIAQERLQHIKHIKGTRDSMQITSDERSPSDPQHRESIRVKRAINTAENSALRAFTRHIDSCNKCSERLSVICDPGLRPAKDVGRLFFVQDGRTYSHLDLKHRKGKVEVEIPQYAMHWFPRFMNIPSIIAKDEKAKAQHEASFTAKVETSGGGAFDFFQGIDKVEKRSISFMDFRGHKFRLPFDRCDTWSKMEQLIKFILLGSGEFESPSSGIGSEVRDGHYDLIGPHGEIILPQVWDTVIEPGLTISMHLWSPPGDTEEDTRKAREDGARSIATKQADAQTVRNARQLDDMSQI